MFSSSWYNFKNRNCIELGNSFLGMNDNKGYSFFSATRYLLPNLFFIVYMPLAFVKFDSWGVISHVVKYSFFLSQVLYNEILSGYILLTPINFL